MSAERSLLIRPARRGEEGELTELAVRSKAYWGYPVEQVESWRADLTISAQTLASQVVYVAQIDDRICGFFALRPDSSSPWEVEHLWVDPKAIGQGVGKALLGFASRYAADHGATALGIDADPNAEAFYAACGAMRVGSTPAPLRQDPLRQRPRMLLAVGKAGSAVSGTRNGGPFDGATQSPGSGVADVCPARDREGEPATLIIGSYLSPYVRKVLVCLDIKGVDYRIDPIVPFYGGDAFARISPVRRIPVLIDDSVTLADSTVICEYLEERYPQPRLLPEGAPLRARARWLEEFADSRMGEVFIWHLFNQVVIRRFVWEEAPDEALLRRAREEELPQVLDYLEGELPAGGYLFGAISTADIAIAAFFRNAAYARYAVDAQRWPRTASFAARVLGHPSFEKLRPFEELLLRTPIPGHRTALGEAGAPVSAKTFGESTPRRGVLTI